MKQKAFSFIAIWLSLYLLGNDALAFRILTDSSQAVESFHSNPAIFLEVRVPFEQEAIPAPAVGMIHSIGTPLAASIRRLLTPKILKRPWIEQIRWHVPTAILIPATVIVVSSFVGVPLLLAVLLAAASGDIAIRRKTPQAVLEHGFKYSSLELLQLWKPIQAFGHWTLVPFLAFFTIFQIAGPLPGGAGWTGQAAHLAIAGIIGYFTGVVNHAGYNWNASVPASTTFEMAPAGIEPPRDTVTHTEAIDQWTDFEARFGFLESDHPAMQYVSGLTDHLLQNVAPERRPTVRVLGRRGFGLGAHIHPDGTIIFSPEFLEFLDSEEELIFAILHEFVHYDRGHFPRLEAAKQSIPQNADMEDTLKSRSLRTALGLMRFDEYEADTTALLLMSERGRNMEGGLQLLRRLQAHDIAERKKKEASTSQAKPPWRPTSNAPASKETWDVAHGFTNNRVVNSKTLTFLRDMKNLSHSLSPLPVELKSSLANLPTGDRLEILDKAKKDDNAAEALAQDAGWPLISRALHIRFPMITTNALLFGRFEVLMKETFPELDDEDRGLLEAFILDGFMDHDILDSVRTRSKVPGRLRDAARATIIQPDAILRFKRLMAGDYLSRTGLVFSPKLVSEFFAHVMRVRSVEGLYDAGQGKNAIFNPGKFFAEATFIARAVHPLSSRALPGLDLSAAVWTQVVATGVKELIQSNQIGNSPTGGVPPLLQFLANVKRVTDLEIYSDWLLSLIEHGWPIVLNDLATARLIPKMPPPAKTQIEIVRNETLRLCLEVSQYKTVNKSEEVMVLSKLMTRLPLSELQGVAENLIAQGRRDHWPQIFMDNIAAIFNEHLVADRSVQCENAAELLQLVRLMQTVAYSQGNYVLSVERAFERVLQNMAANGKSQCVLEWANMLELEKLLFQPVANTSVGIRRTTLEPLCHQEIPSFGILMESALADHVSNVTDPNQFFLEIKEFVARQPVSSLQDLLTVGNVYAAQIVRDAMERIMAHGLRFIPAQQAPAKLADMSEINRDHLLWLSFFIQDGLLQRYIQEQLLVQRTRELSFDEAFSLVFEGFRYNMPSGIVGAAEYLIEEKATLDEHFERLHDQVGRLLRMDSASSAATVGSLVAGEGVLAQFFSDQDELLEHLLRTQSNDLEFKEHYFKKWYGLFKTWIRPAAFVGKISSKFSHTYKLKSKTELDSNAQAAMKEHLAQPLPYFIEQHPSVKNRFYFPLDEAVNFFFRLDRGGKYLLLRHLLMAPGSGVLENIKKRLKLLSNLLEGTLEAGDDTEGAGQIRRVLEAFMRTASSEDLYFAINSLLNRRIANLPDEPATWESAVSSVAKEEVITALATLKRADAVRPYAVQLVQTTAARLVDWINGYPAERRFFRVENALWPIARSGEKTESSARLSPAAMTVEVGSNMGTPGKRGLQLLGQFTRLSPTYKKEFRNVWDAFPGQSRMTMYLKVKQDAPKLLGRMVWHPREGAGSLYTTCRVDVRMDDGKVHEKILKVLNPNARYHKDNTIKSMRDALQDLGAGYSRFSPLVDLIDEWSTGDLDDTTFLQDDIVFRESFNYRRPKHWGDAGYGFTIGIPISDDTGSTEIHMEDFVVGENLHRLPDATLKERQEIASLLVQNYDEQIRGINLLGGSIVWSDLHPGNIRITKDHRVMLLDRHFYLKLNFGDKLLLNNLQSSGKNPAQMTSYFVDYLLAQPANAALKTSLGSDGLAALKAEFAKDLHEGSFEETAVELFIRLHEHGVKIPLKMGLLLKNIISLERICEEANLTLETARNFIPDDSKHKLDSEGKGSKVHSYREGNSFIGRLFLWFGNMVEEVSHGIRGEWAGFTVRWRSLRAWRSPGIDIDEMDTEHDEGPRDEAYHRHALGVAQASLKGHVIVSTILAALETTGIFVLGQERIANPFGIALMSAGLLLGAIAMASSLTVAFGNINRPEKNSDSQRALYHRQELERIGNGTKPFGKTGKELYILGLGLMWTGRSRPYLAGQEADYTAPAGQEIEDYLRYAYTNLGNRHGQVMLDTAAAYGPSEERIGRILRTHPQWLDSAFIATKGGEEWDPATGNSTLKQSAHDLETSFERSLSRLGKINLFYVHQASLKVLQDREAMMVLRRLKETHRGGLEMLGLSISRPDVLEEIVHAARADAHLLDGMDALQIPARVFLDRPDLIRFLHEHGIAIVLNRPHLAAPAGHEKEFYRDLAARPEVSAILGGGRRYLKVTADYFHSSPPIAAPSAKRVMSQTPIDPATQAGNRLKLFRALKAGDFAAARLLVAAAHKNSYFRPALQLKIADLNDPAHRKAWMDAPMGKDIPGMKHFDVSTPAYPPAIDPLGIDSFQRDKARKTGVDDLLIFAYQAGERLESRFYRVRQAQYTESVSDLDEPTYSFVLEDLQTGDSLTLQQNDWYQHGGDPSFDQQNFYWLGTVDDLASDTPLLNLELYGNLNVNLGLSPRKNLGHRFNAGETVLNLISRIERLSGLFHKPGILLPQTHFYLNGESIDPSYRLKAEDRQLTVQVLEYFRFGSSGRVGPILMSVLAIIGLVNQWIGSHILWQHNPWHHQTTLTAAA